MSRRRFFVPQVRDTRAEIAGDEARHLTQVLRVEPGQIYEISDNNSLYLAEVESVRKAQVQFRVLDRLPDPAPEIPVQLLVALFKFDRLELLLEKATELGVTSITFGASRAQRQRPRESRREAHRTLETDRDRSKPAIAPAADARPIRARSFQ